MPKTVISGIYFGIFPITLGTIVAEYDEIMESPARKELALNLMAAGRKVRWVAKETGISERTLHRWKKEARSSVSVKDVIKPTSPVRIQEVQQVQKLQEIQGTQEVKSQEVKSQDVKIVERTEEVEGLERLTILFNDAVGFLEETLNSTETPLRLRVDVAKTIVKHNLETRRTGVEELKALQVLVEAGWVSHEILCVATESIDSINENLREAFTQSQESNQR